MASSSASVSISISRLISRLSFPTYSSFHRNSPSVTRRGALCSLGAAAEPIPSFNALCLSYDTDRWRPHLNWERKDVGSIKYKCPPLFLSTFLYEQDGAVAIVVTNTIHVSPKEMGSTPTWGIHVVTSVHPTVMGTW